MRRLASLAPLLLASCLRAPSAWIPPEPSAPEAPAAFDGASNGLVDEATHDADRGVFDDVEQVSDGLGPLYNAQSCRECHQNLGSGGGSQVTELRVGHREGRGRFENPPVSIAHGKAIIEGRTLINDRAICPSKAFPDVELQERVPESANVRTLRTSLSLFGDGFVEAVADETLREIARWQCRNTRDRVCGRVVEAPVLEAPGVIGVGRFGWKAQHASLLSFAGDAYLNEMGITSRLLKEDVTSLCDGVADPEDKPGADGLADIDKFTRFIRATKAPPRDATLAATDDARKGAEIFGAVGCATCHVPTLLTAPAGTKINGGTFVVPPALGGLAFHPYGDFLLHDVGTGDGIAIAAFEHHGRAYMHMQPTFAFTANRMRTAPLWGVRTKSRLMHDGKSLTLEDAILRHRGEAEDARDRFEALDESERAQLLAFLRSL